MGSAKSLYSVEISVYGYAKKHLLVTRYQLKHKIGDIVVDYISGLEPYRSRENFINKFYDGLAEIITVGGMILPQRNLSYKKIERYMIQYITSVIYQCVEQGEGLDIDNMTSITINSIEDITAIRV